MSLRTVKGKHLVCVLSANQCLYSMIIHTELLTSLVLFSAVMYMQSNPGGVTIFGWTVNRAFMDTIFCAELTVVTFVLGKTLTFTTNHT